MKIELLGGYTKEELDLRIKKIAAAGKLSRYPGNVFEVLETCNDTEKNIRLIKRIIGMGHKSIIEHDYLVFALCDVTPIVEQTIIGNRLTSFTIKSRREVDFRNVGFYIPNFRDKNMMIHKDNETLKEKYIKHMKYMFNTYGNIVDLGINVEDARFILPYSYHSNIIMGLDVRELEKLIVSLVSGTLSDITDLKDFGNELLSITKQYVPYLEESIDKELQKTTMKKPFEYLENLYSRPKIKIIDKPKMISYTSNPDDVILKSSIMYHYQCDTNTANEILKQCIEKDKFFKENLMDIILHKEERRELEQVEFTFQIPISLSILTHLTRHRTHSLLIPEFTPLWNFNNYVTPSTISANVECLNLYKNAIQENIKMVDYFKSEGVIDEDLVHFYLGCQMLNVVTTLNARTAQWICRMRCCNKAQWQIRNIAKEIAKQINEVAPLLGKGLGPTCITDLVCNEGKESCGLINTLTSIKNK